jgi:beta-galactosidase
LATLDETTSETSNLLPQRRSTFAPLKPFTLPRGRTGRNNTNNHNNYYRPRPSVSVASLSAAGAICMTLAIFFVTLYPNDAGGRGVFHLHDNKNANAPYPFPAHNFTWGVATSAYQIEGAVDSDGRGETIWDVFTAQPGRILDASDGRVACDHYHRVTQDVQLMASLNIQAYRFSIAWSRILPNGTGAVNPQGVAFYNHLIDTLLAHQITPWVTLFHWDLPQALEDRYGGWLDVRTAEAFRDYAAVCFAAFGDRVQHWITINEAWTVAVNGYGSGIHAPGHQSATEPYIVGHHLLLAHGWAVQAFRQANVSSGGQIGIANCGDFRYPLTVAEQSTAERVMLFQNGWFTDPLFFGDYPSVMRERLGPRLPSFTARERELLTGSVDFVGLNYYSSLQVTTPMVPPTYTGYWTDIDAKLIAHPEWKQNDMGWPVVPDGLRNMLLWISERYQQPVIYVTENGSAEHEPTLSKALQDKGRQDYLTGHLRAIGQALERGVQLQGYFAWSLMDNFEWQLGYQRRFGLCWVDFQDGTLTRTPKGSAKLYNRTILARGRNIARVPPVSWFPSVR